MTTTMTPLTGREFVAYIDQLSDEFGSDKVFVTGLRRSGKLVLDRIQTPDGEVTVMVDWS